MMTPSDVPVEDGGACGRDSHACEHGRCVWCGHSEVWVEANQPADTHSVAPDLPTIEKAMGNLVTAVDRMRDYPFWTVKDEQAFLYARGIWDQVHNAVHGGTRSSASTDEEQPHPSPV